MMITSEGSILQLRTAMLYDALIIYKWAMDPDVRANSLNKGSFSFTDHLKWYTGKLHDPHCRMYILESHYPLGQIRIDKDSGLWVINYSIDSNFRGKGFGTEIVRMGMELTGKGKYLAKVRCENLPSLKIFRNLNFNEEAGDDTGIVNFIFEKA